MPHQGTAEVSLNKTELIDAISDTVGSRATASRAVEAIVDQIQRSVAVGEKVAISGFGVFERAERAARLGRNPATGEAVKIKKSQTPKFRPGSDFKAYVSGTKKLAKAAPATALAGASSATGRAKATAASAAGKATRAVKAAGSEAAGVAKATTAKATKAAAAAAAPAKGAVKATTAKAPAAKAPAAKAPAAKAPAAKAPVAKAKAPATVRQPVPKAPAKKAPAKKAAR